MINQLTKPEIQEFIKDHLYDEPSSLMLKANHYPDWPMKLIVEQIQAKRKAKTKLPSWFKTRGLIYPPVLSMEQCSSENTADAVVELLERPQLNGLFHWAGTEEVSRYQLAIRTLRHFGINSEKIIPGSVQTAKAEVGERPNHLSFILEPLSAKLCVQPLSIEEQIGQLKIPSDMYSWYRQFADSPSSYIHRF